MILDLWLSLILVGYRDNEETMMIYDVLAYGIPLQQDKGPAEAPVSAQIMAPSATFPKHLFKLCSPEYFNIDCPKGFEWDNYPWRAGMGMIPVLDATGYVLITRMVGAEKSHGIRSITAYYASIRARDFSPLSLLSLFPLRTWLPASPLPQPLAFSSKLERAPPLVARART